MKTNEYNNMNFKQVDIYYKILLIGPRKVGKTQILRRICKEDFNENYSPSFGIDFRILKYHSENLVVQLIELAGKAGISSEIIKDYIIESDCFICVYDITNINSVQELISLVKFYENIIPENNKEQFWYFVGNKNDDSRRECTNRQEKLFPDVPKKGRSVFNINGKVIVKENFGFIEISTKNDKDINIMFKNVIRQINEMRNNKINERNENKNRGRNNRNINNNNDDNFDSSRKFNENISENKINSEKDNNNDKEEKKHDKKCEIF